MVTEVAFTTVTVANVIVWIDENGVPIETKTVSNTMPVQSTLIESTPASSSFIETKPTPAEPVVALTAEPAPTALAPSLDVAPVRHEVSAVSSEPKSASEESKAPSSTPASSSAIETHESSIPEPTSSKAPDTPSPSPEPSPESRPQKKVYGERLPIGITYDPFKVGDCKTEQDIETEWEQVKQYGIVRIYGMGCKIIPTVVRLAYENNQKVFAGIWLTGDGSSEDLDTVVRELTMAVRNQANGDWSIIGLVSVENERVNDKTMTASAVVDAIRRARDALRFQGYNGPVGAVETVPAMIDNPMICEESDLALVNVHSFFDRYTKAENSGPFIKGQVDMVSKACGGKRVVVCEAGWPHMGESNGAAVPSRENQKRAVDSILGSFDSDLFLFNAFDSNWKSDWAGSFSAERYWGMFQ